MTYSLVHEMSVWSRIFLPTLFACWSQYVWLQLWQILSVLQVSMDDEKHHSFQHSCKPGVEFSLFFYILCFSGVTSATNEDVHERLTLEICLIVFYEHLLPVHQRSQFVFWYACRNSSSRVVSVPCFCPWTWMKCGWFYCSGCWTSCWSRGPEDNLQHN